MIHSVRYNYDTDEYRVDLGDGVICICRLDEKHNWRILRNNKWHRLIAPNCEALEAYIVDNNMDIFMDSYGNH